MKLSHFWILFEDQPYYDQSIEPVSIVKAIIK